VFTLRLRRRFGDAKGGGLWWGISPPICGVMPMRLAV
jgi:hypothetical protein